MAAPSPIAAPSVPLADSSGRPTQPWFEYFKSIDKAFRTLLGDFTTLNGNAASFLTTAGNQNLTGGFTSTEFDNGTPTNGSSITIDPSKGLKQNITNNVAGFTILPTTECGDVELRIINGASAGTITFDPTFHRKYPGGDTPDTTNTNQFIAFIFGFGAAGADYIVRKRQ